MSAGRILLIFFLLPFYYDGFAQQTQTGKALNFSRNEKNDTSRVNQLIHLCDSIFRSKPVDAISYANEALNLATRLHFTKGEAFALKYIGLGYYVQAEYVKAANFLNQSLEKYESIDYKPGIANILNNLGSIFNNEGDDSKALELYLKSLKISEEIKDSIKEITALVNIGLIYSKKQFTIEKAEGYYKKALLKSEGMKYPYGIGTAAVNLGELYFSKGDYATALSYFEKSLVTYKNSKTGNISYTLVNIGMIYARQKDYGKAIRYQEEALQMATSVNSKLEIAHAEIGLAGTYHQKGELIKAIVHYRACEKIAKEIGARYELKTTYEGMAQAYSEIEDYKKAFHYQQEVSKLKDTIYSETSQVKINQLMFQNQLESINKENELLKRDASLQEVRNKQQKTIITFLFLGFLSISIFTILLVRAKNHKKKVNAELAQKNSLITAQKLEITASIQYASTIQTALLTPEEQITKLFPENFILFRPRDIVSGDFYWLSDDNDRTICIVADCTGHGVPGAFMSMLGIAFLSEIVSKNPEISANEILNEMRHQVEISLRQTGRMGDSRDGMDVALLIFDRKKNRIEFAGANNPLIIIRDNEIVEYKPDKMPIGYRDATDKSFTNHLIEVETGDMLYMFSDGYRDQFGGPEGKRFMIRNFRNLLLEIHTLEMSAQKLFLEQRLNEWIYNTEQIDDILVMGIRV